MEAVRFKIWKKYGKWEHGKH